MQLLGMGFRYQKRIKLGKGFGLNISKLGIKPSYRSKKGSISTKGYSNGYMFHVNTKFK